MMYRPPQCIDLCCELRDLIVFTWVRPRRVENAALFLRCVVVAYDLVVVAIMFTFALPTPFLAASWSLTM
jgi:hypothetical protein